MIRPLLFCLLVGTSVSALAQDSAPPESVLTLEQAVNIAQANNRSVKNAQLFASIDDDQIAEARTYRFPSINLYALGSQLLTPVNFTFQQGAFGTFPGIGPVPATNTQIHTPLRPTFYALTQFSQPLSQQYKFGLNIKQAKLTKLVDEQKLRAQKQSVTSQVKQTYYAILRTQSSLASSQENLKFDRELDRTTEQYLAEKTPEATTMEASLDAAQAQALSARPELAEARLAVQQAELNRRITKTQYIPDVSLAVNNLSLTNINLLPSYVAAAGVLVSWDPIDWGRRKHELAAASKTIEQSKNSANETEAQILVEVDAKFRKLGETRALLHATTLQRDAEREKLRVVMNQFEQKTALLKDVLQQKMSLETVTNQYNQALLSFWTAKADFEKSLGEE